MIGYHVTPKKNLSSILSEGLKPLIGPRSSLAEEDKACIYLFKDQGSAEDAIMNWLGDELEEEDELVLLEVNFKDLDHLIPDSSFEILVFENISSDRLTNLGPI